MYSSKLIVLKCEFLFIIIKDTLFIQVTFSNPAEVAKTRLQLQGELVKSGGVKVYQNTLDVLIKTGRNEGIRGIQKGLGPAVRGKT